MKYLVTFSHPREDVQIVLDVQDGTICKKSRESLAKLIAREHAIICRYNLVSLLSDISALTSGGYYR